MFAMENFMSGLQNILKNIHIEVNNGNIVLSRLNRNSALDQAQAEIIGEIPFQEIQMVMRERKRCKRSNTSILQ